MLTFDLMTCEELNFEYLLRPTSDTSSPSPELRWRMWCQGWTWVRCWRHLPRWCVPWEDDREVSRIFPPPGGWTSIKSRMKVPQCCTYNSNRLRQSSRWKAIEQKVTATAQIHSHDPVSFATAIRYCSYTGRWRCNRATIPEVKVPQPAAEPLNSEASSLLLGLHCEFVCDRKPRFGDSAIHDLLSSIIF